MSEIVALEVGLDFSMIRCVVVFLVLTVASVTFAANEQPPGEGVDSPAAATTMVVNQQSTAPRPSGGRRATWEHPYTLVSSTSLLSYLEELTAIRPHAGWRSCGSSGEAQARDLIAAKLTSESRRLPKAVPPVWWL